MIKYKIFPFIKVKMTYWWWVLKYGGKEKISPEVIFGALEKSTRGLSENMGNAFRAMESDALAEEKKLALDLMAKVQEFQDEFQKVEKEVEKESQKREF